MLCGAPVRAMEGYGARRLGGCRRGRPATGDPVRRQRRGPACRRAVVPMRGTTPPLVGHGGGDGSWRLRPLVS
jgi:hypothetical protein